MNLGQSLRFLQIFLLNHHYSNALSSLNGNKKINSENCGNPTTRTNLALHKTRCSTGSLLGPSCTNYSTKSQTENNYHIAKKPSAKSATNVHKSNIYDKDFHSFFKL